MQEMRRTTTDDPQSARALAQIGLAAPTPVQSSSLLGHIAITPGRANDQQRANVPGTPSEPLRSTSGEKPQSGQSGQGMPQAHAVQLLLRPPPAPKAALMLEPEELTFGEVQVGGGGAPVLPQSFRIVNTGTAQVNFMLMLQKVEMPQVSTQHGLRGRSVMSES